jgi:hypothetical protein
LLMPIDPAGHREEKQLKREGGGRHRPIVGALNSPARTRLQPDPLFGHDGNSVIRRAASRVSRSGDGQRGWSRSDGALSFRFTASGVGCRLGQLESAAVARHR